MIAHALTISSIVFGGFGFVLFLGCKISHSKSQSGSCTPKFLSKLLIAIGVFLLAGAVFELSNTESYCSTLQDPNSLWSYRTFSRPATCGDESQKKDKKSK